MRPKEQVSARKLRGGFYTPEPLVKFCLERLDGLLPPSGRFELLEPSAGDGAFLRGVATSRLARRCAKLVAVEPLDLEAKQCRRALAEAKIEGKVHVESALKWGNESQERFDAAVGNPPFVRYQFISPADRQQIPTLGAKAGISFAGVSNLWLPVLVAALSRLKPGGAFSFVVPTELLTGLAASRLRGWLGSHFADLRVDLFPPGSFPAVLQEIAVLSGRTGRPAAAATLTIGEHDRLGSERAWTHPIDPEQTNWTRYLLEPAQLVALDAALAEPAVTSLGSLARFQVSVVTGANDFFTVSDDDLRTFELKPWSRPLLPRIRHARGLVYTKKDQVETRRSGARGWLLDFAEGAADPTERDGAAAYLRSGEERGLPERYKCRIRKPWFRVPHIERGSLFLSKRSHRYPRVIVNEAAAYTTDTIYRGSMLPGAALSAHALSASFHNSLTLLSAELEGRSFGGGVLELVPSEIERLAAVAAPQAAAWIERLDKLARLGHEEALVEATDQALVGAGLLDNEIVARLSEARLELSLRRLLRNSRVTGVSAGSAAAEELAA